LAQPRRRLGRLVMRAGAAGAGHQVAGRPLTCHHNVLLWQVRWGKCRQNGGRTERGGQVSLI
jgi:hypothetical protein